MVQQRGHPQSLVATEVTVDSGPEFSGIPVWRGNAVVSAGDQSPCGTLNRYLLIFKRLIFESRVFAGRPSFAAAPPAPEIRPWLSFSAASIISFSCRTRVPPSIAVRDAAGGSSRLDQVSSTAKLSPSDRITAPSIPVCSSRTSPGLPYDSRTFKDFLPVDRIFFPTLFPQRSMKYSASKGI